MCTTLLRNLAMMPILPRITEAAEAEQLGKASTGAHLMVCDLAESLFTEMRVRHRGVSRQNRVELAGKKHQNRVELPTLRLWKSYLTL